MPLAACSAAAAGSSCGPRRVLGQDHPDTLTSAGNLAQSPWYQGEHAEAEGMLQAAFAARRRVLGSAHPADTLANAEDSGSMRSEMRATQPTKKGPKAAARKERAAALALAPTLPGSLCDGAGGGGGEGGPGGGGGGAAGIAWQCSS